MDIKYVKKKIYIYKKCITLIKKILIRFFSFKHYTVVIVRIFPSNRNAATDPTGGRLPDGQPHLADRPLAAAPLRVRNQDPPIQTRHLSGRRAAESSGGQQGT